jgi:hypothetical protein
MEPGDPYLIDSKEEFMLVGQGRPRLESRESRAVSVERLSLPLDDDQREVVLIQSRSASVELLGAIKLLDREGRIEDQVSSGRLFVSNPGADDICAIRSESRRAVYKSERSRPAPYVLIWRGRIPQFDREWIERSLNQNLPDIETALMVGDPQLIKWNISEVIFAIARGRRHMQERAGRWREVLWLIIAVFAMTLFVVLLLVLLRTFSIG